MWGELFYGFGVPFAILLLHICWVYFPTPGTDRTWGDGELCHTLSSNAHKQVYFIILMSQLALVMISYTNKHL